MSRKTIYVDTSDGMLNGFNYIIYKDKKYIDSEYVDKIKEERDKAYQEIEERDMEDLNEYD